MKRAIILAATAFVSQLALAQWRFSITINGTTFSRGPFASKAECEQNRQYEIAANTWSHFIDLGGGRGGSISMKATATPCTGPGGGTVGSVNLLGVDNGGSFFSTNPANEISDWSSDHMERMLALSPGFANSPKPEISMGSPETDRARASARASAFVIDGSKPFRSLNIDDEGDIITGSTDLDMFEPLWQTEKKSRRLPDANVFAYRDRMHSEAEAMLAELLNRSKYTKEVLEGKIWEWNYILNDYYLRTLNSTSAERETLEKVLLLAQYKVEYKAVLVNRDNISLQEADDLMTTVEGLYTLTGMETPRQKEQRDLEGREKELIAKGISPEDIQSIKTDVENDALRKDHVATTITEVAEAGGNLNNMFLPEDSKGSEVIDGILEAAGNGVALGVIANNMITMKAYDIELKAIETRIKEMETNSNKMEQAYLEEARKISDIDEILKAASNSADGNRYEALTWATNTDRVLSRVKERSKNDYYGAFPGISKKELAGREYIPFIRSGL